MGLNEKAFTAASILNAMDLATSYACFLNGYTELNAWMHVFHNPWLAALVAVVMYQLMIALLYVIVKAVSTRLPAAWLLYVGFMAVKAYAVINNITLLV